MDKKILAIIAVVAVIGLIIAGVTIVMANGSQGKTINSIDDLKGATIAVENGTTGDILMTELYEQSGDATVKRYTTYPDAFMDLKNKKVDAIVMDKAPAEAYVKSYDGVKILSDKFDTDPEEYGFVFKKGNTSLQTSFNTALATLKANGTITNIEKYWADHLNGEADPFITETGTGTLIKVGTSPDFPPYDTMYGTKYTGIDMDIVRAVCNELNYRVSFVQYDFESIIPAINSDAIDVGASGFSITPERAETVLFSSAYTTTEQVVVVRA